MQSCSTNDWLAPKPQQFPWFQWLVANLAQLSATIPDRKAAAKIAAWWKCMSPVSREMQHCSSNFKNPVLIDDFSIRI